MFCKSCGKEIANEAVICVHCGVSASAKSAEVTQGKEWLTTFILCFFLGGFGIHRFYVGKTGTGVAMLLTLGGCGIWTLVDLIMIATNSFKDAKGQDLIRN